MFGRDASDWAASYFNFWSSLKNFAGSVQMVGCDMRSPRCGPDAPPTLEPHAPRLVDFCSLALIAAYCSFVRPSGT